MKSDLDEQIMSPGSSLSLTLLTSSSLTLTSTAALKKNPGLSRDEADKKSCQVAIFVQRDFLIRQEFRFEVKRNLFSII